MQAEQHNETAVSLQAIHCATCLPPPSSNLAESGSVRAPGCESKAAELAKHAELIQLRLAFHQFVTSQTMTSRFKRDAIYTVIADEIARMGVVNAA